MPKNAFSLTNLDDKNGLVMTQNTRSKVYTYSLRSLSDFKGRVIESHFEGMLLDFNNHELAVQFIGKFNASNLLEQPYYWAKKRKMYFLRLVRFIR